MGEHQRRRITGLATNGHQIPVIRSKRIRVVNRVKLENQQGMTFMMLGDHEPEIATALTPAQARELAGHLIHHADEAEKEARRIIVPGMDL